MTQTVKNDSESETVSEFQLRQRQEVGSGVVNAEEQQRAVDVGAAGVDGQRRRVETSTPRLQRREHQTQSWPHRIGGWQRSDLLSNAEWGESGLMTNTTFLKIIISANFYL